MCNNKIRKLIKRKRVKRGRERKRERVGSKWMMWQLMGLNRSITTINATFQLIYIYYLFFLLTTQ